MKRAKRRNVKKISISRKVREQFKALADQRDRELIRWIGKHSVKF